MLDLTTGIVPPPLWQLLSSPAIIAHSFLATLALVGYLIFVITLRMANKQKGGAVGTLALTPSARHSAADISRSIR